MNHIDLLNLWEQAYVSYYNPQPGEPQDFTNVVRRIEKVVRTAGDLPENHIFVKKVQDTWVISNPSHSNLPISQQFDLMYYPHGSKFSTKPGWAIYWKPGELEVIDARMVVRVIQGWIKGF